MFRPKKTIPKLAVGMLALTGCGDDGGGGTGGSDGGNFDASLNAFCMNASCFNPLYTVEDCVDYYTNETPKHYDIDAECEAALITYFDCGAPKTCDQLLAGACDDEYYAWFEDHCTPLP